MFEKEADFAETKMLINCNGDYSKKQNYKKGWQDGAEFGYNKAKEIMCLMPGINRLNTQKIQYIKELQEEIAELKAFRQDCVKLTEDNVVMAMQRAEMARKLTKAKEIIKKFSEFVNNDVEYDTEHPQEHTDSWNKLCEQAEQFLKEVEK